jgi:hypothetical protein
VTSTPQARTKNTALPWLIGAIVVAAVIGEVLEPNDATDKANNVPPSPPAVVAKQPAAASNSSPLEALPVEMQGAEKASTRTSGELRITGESYIGCQMRDDYEYLTSLSVQGDMDAFRTAYATAIVTGRCVKLKPGATVYLDDTALFSGLIRVRPKGELAAYWTGAEAAN